MDVSRVRSRLMGRFVSIFACLLAAGAAGCTAATVPDPTVGPSVLPPSITADPSPSSATAEPSPIPTVVPNPAPDELVGSWTTTIVLDETVVLAIEPGAYRIVRGGNSGSGLIDVVGDEITFHSSNLCSGMGTYLWAVEGGQLTFTAVGDDPCDGRSLVLLDVTYER
jgi:hypothetical protein